MVADVTLTHVNEKGEARMVDVGEKAVTHREAVARSIVRMKAETLALLLSGDTKKGDVLAAARIAGIMAAKRTGELIPLCHPIALDHAEVEITPGDGCLIITSRVSCSYRTGVEMEALTAVSVAALTVYDMLKAVDRGMTIDNTCLLSKTGGKSGTWLRDE